MENNADTCNRVESKLTYFREEVNRDNKNKKNNFPTDNHTSCLASLNLDALPPSVLQMHMITALILDHNNLKQLPATLCENLHLLQKLSLIGNELVTIPNNIKLLSRLTELHLTANKITKIPSSICELEELKILKMADNILKKLPSTIGNLTNLIEIDLSENQLRLLPDSFCWLKNLEILDCSENKLKLLSMNFGYLQNLRILNLKSNFIAYLPNSTSKFECLELLDLSNNKLDLLMPTLHCANLLKKIYVDCNFLVELPPWFNLVENLEELSLRNNRLQDAPFSNEFGQIAKKLRTFDLAGNFIDKLCESFGELSNLESIHLGSIMDVLENRNYPNGNWITFLPDNFGMLEKLKELRLDENRIKKLTNNFGCLVNLEMLDLAHNCLNELPDSFGNLKSLKMCQLSKNGLMRLPESLGNLVSLVDLRLDNNEIEELPDSLFGLTQLQTLDLFNNKLRIVPIGLKNLTNLVSLDLNENDFGIPISEIPQIVYRIKYNKTDPALKNNWRERSQINTTEKLIDENCDTFQELNGENYKNCDDVMKSLEKALLQSKTIWKTEGGEEERRKKIVRVEKEQIPESVSFYDEEVSDSECEDDYDDGSDNYSFNNYNNVEAQEPENWDEDIMKFERLNFPYDDIPICDRNAQRYLESDLMNMHEHINQEMFCPSDIHAKPILRGPFDYYQEDGQFDDAE